MIKRLFKTVLYSGAIGLCVVLCRWIIELIFNREPFEYGYLSDFMIGVSTYIILTLLIEINKIRKERCCNGTLDFYADELDYIGDEDDLQSMENFIEDYFDIDF